MRTYIIALAAAALFAGPALAADQHAGHHSAPGHDQHAGHHAGSGHEQHAGHHAAAGGPTHEMCKSVIGRQMDGKPAHDHGRDKTGAATSPPHGKPLTAAEMEKMHKACAERMQAAEEPAKTK